MVRVTRLSSSPEEFRRFERAQRERDFARHEAEEDRLQAAHDAYVERCVEERESVDE